MFRTETIAGCLPICSYSLFIDCDITLSALTCNSFCASKVPLEYSPELERRDYPRAGLDMRLLRCTRNDGLDRMIHHPTPSIMGSLPAGRYWSHSEGTGKLPISHAVA